MAKLPDTGEGEEYELRPSREERLYGPGDQKEVTYRAEVFEGYGFTYPQALELARRKDIDHHKIKKMLQGGCIHLLVLEIVL